MQTEAGSLVAVWPNKICTLRLTKAGVTVDVHIAPREIPREACWPEVMHRVDVALEKLAERLATLANVDETSRAIVGEETAFGEIDRTDLHDSNR